MDAFAFWGLVQMRLASECCHLWYSIHEMISIVQIYLLLSIQIYTQTIMQRAH